MKKTYIIPEALTVELGSIRMIAESVVDVDPTPVNPGDFETKEIKDVNVWDEEW